MPLSPIGRACLVAREGRRLLAYRDVVGVWTIGIGHTAAAGPPAPRAGLRITAAECDAVFEHDVARYVAAVETVAGATLADHQADALISFCYNVGPAAFAGSTAARRLEAGALAAVPAALLLWDRPSAILARRRAEAEQFAIPYTQALPRPTASAPPIAVAADVRAGDERHPAQDAPPLEPVHAPAHPWRDSFGAFVDRVFGDGAAAPDLAARG